MLKQRYFTDETLNTTLRKRFFSVIFILCCKYISLHYYSKSITKNDLQEIQLRTTIINEKEARVLM